MQDENRVHEYMALQPEINAKMRSILVDWLIEVHHKFELMPETLYLTINLVDRFLSVKVVPRRELQLVGISSMLLASKYEEIWAPEVAIVVCLCILHVGSLSWVLILNINLGFWLLKWAGQRLCLHFRQCLW